ncbi:Crp/Fnr family transcriptional regulator [Sphingomonas sp. NFR15]|uniref:Crp/Fnr family transcriptional regulator n=1 Tax=Sphingomonas sp. NFR15 TaxID=1566282 RepID=UPI000884005B|nr:Crp/Fnr family transcriptional regulator [Sphingomonas sp. NFR15]SDA11687.1 cAMP-binding domain of CRP or a regulatory subunit of cAMP-dependent protein kinases [Sphingomonas sp. NFR15]
MSVIAIPPTGDFHPALRRLAAMVELTAADRVALRGAVGRERSVKARGELLQEGKPIRERLLVLSGWAARVRILQDGRRQIINFLLPGDLIGNCSHANPLAPSTVAALTPLTVCSLPDPATSPTLCEAYALSAATETAYLMAQIVRLGRMTASERVEDLLLELMERLEITGLAREGHYAMPITQETIADALGLTSVHVNRMLQRSRQAKRLRWARGAMEIAAPAEMRRDVGRMPVRVSQ